MDKKTSGAARASSKGREGRTRPRRNVTQSIVNNLNSISDDRYNARQAKFYLRRLREELGMSEQKLIIDLILTGFEMGQAYADVKERLRCEWQTSPDNVQKLI